MKITEIPNPQVGPNVTKSLLVAPEVAQIIDIPFPILKGMFDKASKSVGNPSFIWRIPATPNPCNGSSAQSTFMVHSSSSGNPHRVMASTQCGKVLCDKACINWCTCIQSVFTCPRCSRKYRDPEVLKWFKKQKRAPNLSGLANVNMPQNKGRKAGTRKKKANQQPTEGLPVVFSRVSTCHSLSDHN